MRNHATFLGGNDSFTTDAGSKWRKNVVSSLVEIPVGDSTNTTGRHGMLRIVLIGIVQHRVLDFQEGTAIYVS
jgi:hypothetical protein